VAPIKPASADGVRENLLARPRNRRAIHSRSRNPFRSPSKYQGLAARTISSAVSRANDMIFCLALRNLAYNIPKVSWVVAREVANIKDRIKDR
jgi:hypothetical protein